MQQIIAFIATLIGPDKLAGYVRAGIASLFGIAIARWPLLSQVVDPQTQALIGTAVATIVVGVWQQFAKSDAGKVGMVDAMAKDPNSPVRGVIVNPTAAGRDLARSMPGETTAVAGTFDANVIAKSTGGL